MGREGRVNGRRKSGLATLRESGYLHRCGAALLVRQSIPVAITFSKGTGAIIDRGLWYLVPT